MPVTTDPEMFTVGECRHCGFGDQVLLAEQCRACLTNASAESIDPETIAQLNRTYAAAAERLLGTLEGSAPIGG